MAPSGVSGKLMTRVLSAAHGRATKYFAAVAVAVFSLLGAATPAVAAKPETLTVVVLGSGGVVSKPAGIDCPGTCTATFAAGTKVVLTPELKDGSSFLHWGAPCSGTGACTVRLSALTAVAAQFSAGAKPHPHPQPHQTTAVAVPGSYSGSSRGNYGTISFFVAPGGTSLLNVTVPNLGIACAPAGSFPSSYNLGILETTINPNGSFTATGTQKGVFAGGGAIFSYSFSGRFQRATAAGPATAAGTFRGGVVFPSSGATEHCTSNSQAWTATHDPQPAPQKSIAVPGSYSGSSRGNYGTISFFVAPGGTSMLNIAVPNVGIACTPAGSFPSSDHLSILQTAITANGWFTATGTDEGVIDNANAKFTYVFTGYFEGATPAGPVTVAGTYREDIAFEASGANETCTSNEQSWSATHDPQPAPQKSIAVPGSYSGSSSGNYGAITFSVSPGGTSLTNLAVPNVGIACAPAGSFPSSVDLNALETTINPNGSFTAAGTQAGVFDNSSAKFTYSFAGYFEGATPAGPLTVAGTFREDVVFAASGVTESCTSGAQSWAATRT